MNSEHDLHAAEPHRFRCRYIIPTQFGSEETVLTHTHISMDTSPPQPQA